MLDIRSILLCFDLCFCPIYMSSQVSQHVHGNWLQEDVYVCWGLVPVHPLVGTLWGTSLTLTSAPLLNIIFRGHFS